MFVWIGSRASDDEKKNALPMAHVSFQYSNKRGNARNGLSSWPVRTNIEEKAHAEVLKYNTYADF